MKRALEALRAVPGAVRFQIGASHGLLLLCCLWGEVPYLVMQALLAAELILLTIATMPLYPERGLRRHLRDLLMTTGSMSFFLFFIVVSYGVARNPDNDDPLVVAGRVFLGVDKAAIAWALAYVAAHLVVSLGLAWRSADPRKFWVQEVVLTGSATLVAMLFMIFVAFFVGMPLLALLGALGIRPGADALLIVLMVLLRAFFSLVTATFSKQEIEALARNPYADGQ